MKHSSFSLPIASLKALLSWQQRHTIIRLSSRQRTGQVRQPQLSTSLQTSFGQEITNTLDMNDSQIGPTPKESAISQTPNLSKTMDPSIKKSLSGGQKDNGQEKRQERTTFQATKPTGGSLTCLQPTKMLNSSKGGQWA